MTGSAKTARVMCKLVAAVYNSSSCVPAALRQHSKLELGPDDSSQSPPKSLICARSIGANVAVACLWRQLRSVNISKREELRGRQRQVTPS